MTREHTPGPWNLVRLASAFDSRVVGYGIKYGAAGNRLAMVDGEGNSSDHNEANARLIAAAPDMLAALKECEEYFDNRADADGDSTGFTPNAEMNMLVMVRAAIAKATSP